MSRKLTSDFTHLALACKKCAAVAGRGPMELCSFLDGRQYKALNEVSALVDAGTLRTTFADNIGPNRTKRKLVLEGF